MKRLVEKKLDKKNVVSKIRKLKIPSLFILVILLSYSCNDKHQNEQTLLDSIELSNGIYTDNIKQLKDFFES